MTAAGFKRLWKTPRRASGGGLLDPQTPRQRYLVEQSRARYRRRPDAYPAGEEVLKGELGHIDSFRFIMDAPVPDVILLDTMPGARSTAAALAQRMAAGAEQLGRVLVIGGAGYSDSFTRGYLAAMRSGGGAILMGMDLASGPDWTAVHTWPDLVPVPPAPILTPLDRERITLAELKRARRRIKLRRLSAKGAIGRA